MLFDVYDYSNVIIGQVEANDAVEAWSKAGKNFNNIFDVRATKLESPISYEQLLMPPNWAKELVHSAVEWWEEQTEQTIPEPELSWVIGEYRLRTEGHAYIYDNIIAIIEGPDLSDAKITLLHELAHIITQDPGHSDNFWDVAVQLYQWAGFSSSEMFTLEEERFRDDLEQALERLELRE